MQGSGHQSKGAGGQQKITCCCYTWKCSLLMVPVLVSLLPCLQVDADPRQTPGWKYNHWEMKVCMHELLPACAWYSPEYLTTEEGLPFGIRFACDRASLSE